MLQVHTWTQPRTPRWSWLFPSPQPMWRAMCIGGGYYVFVAAGYFWPRPRRALPGGVRRRRPPRSASPRPRGTRLSASAGRLSLWTFPPSR